MQEDVSESTKDNNKWTLTIIVKKINLLQSGELIYEIIYFFIWLDLYFSSTVMMENPHNLGKRTLVFIT